MARSTTKNPKNRLQCAQIKLAAELESLEKWENNWKIKVNLNKSNIGIRWSHITNLELLGGIEITNIPVAIVPSRPMTQSTRLAQNVFKHP